MVALINRVVSNVSAAIVPVVKHVEHVEHTVTNWAFEDGREVLLERIEQFSEAYSLNHNARIDVVRREPVTFKDGTVSDSSKFSPYYANRRRILSSWERMGVYLTLKNASEMSEVVTVAQFSYATILLSCISFDTVKGLWAFHNDKQLTQSRIKNCYLKDIETVWRFILFKGLSLALSSLRSSCGTKNIKERSYQEEYGDKKIFENPVWELPEDVKDPELWFVLKDQCAWKNEGFSPNFLAIGRMLGLSNHTAKKRFEAMLANTSAVHVGNSPQYKNRQDFEVNCDLRNARERQDYHNWLKIFAPT